MEISRIIIKGESGYGSVFEAYRDKVVITPSSITYEYIPGVENNIKSHRKWSYRTDSPEFSVLYKKIADMALPILHNDQILFATDVGATDISVTYKDKHRESAHFFCPSEFFKDWFQLIKCIVPPCEEIPMVLQTDEDIEGTANAEGV
ncbi:MAG: hypothetical protein LIV24_09235 [Eubacterium sp.]|nr:hypothetical protein [Eubacterium sp.]